MKYVIGITGPQRSGKDTLARRIAAAIQDTTDLRVEVISLAGPLWAAVRGLLSRDLDEHSDAKDDRSQGPSPRDYALAIGAGLRREMGDMTLIDLWTSRVRKSPADVVVCPDVRTTHDLRYFQIWSVALLGLGYRGGSDALLAPEWVSYCDAVCTSLAPGQTTIEPLIEYALCSLNKARGEA